MTCPQRAVLLLRDAPQPPPRITLLMRAALWRMVILFFATLPAKDDIPTPPWSYCLDVVCYGLLNWKRDQSWLTDASFLLSFLYAVGAALDSVLPRFACVFGRWVCHCRNRVFETAND